MSMDTLPVCAVDGLQVGPMGLTIGEIDEGGSDGSGLAIIPAVKVTWFDERQTCPTVLEFVHDGGSCARGGVCAFHEDADADVWRKAADWRLLPGGGAVHRALWPVYGLEALP
jgi:hypothetical protein